MIDSLLINRLADPAQMEVSASQLDGITCDLEMLLRYASSKLIQGVGILMNMSQESIARSIILLQRYYLGPDGGSMLDNDLMVGIEQITYHVRSRCANACGRMW